MSSSSNLSQSAYSPSDPETPQNSRLQNFDQSLSHGNIGHSIEQSIKNALKEIHQKRLQSLRKELDYLKGTEWKFDSDKGLSQ
ncbi:unnamed protein product [Leptosia nina]|uniref:Uncharacterized protein n=1 Tax=Leptosia nina TaxID=320188 RepID=A0AAV1IU01_9NEOP